MYISAIKVSGGFVGVVTLLECADFANLRQHFFHLTLADEALRIEGDEQILRLGFHAQVEKRIVRRLFPVVIGAIPVGRYARNTADSLRLLIIADKVEHKIITAVRMLIIWRIEIHKVDSREIFCQNIGVCLVDFNIAGIFGENRHRNIDISHNSRQGISAVAAKLTDTCAGVFVKSLEHARCVILDRSLENQRCDKEMADAFVHIFHILTGCVNIICVAGCEKDTLAFFDVLIVFRRIKLADKA